LVFSQDDFIPQGTFDNVWEHFCLFQLERRGRLLD
jgi:hypothetical protein